MINQRIERFLEQQEIEISPYDYKKVKDESYTKRKYGSPVYFFHDTNGIQHYLFKNKDYRRKILIVQIDFDKRSQEYPSRKRISNLKNIIRTFTHKNRILTEKTIKNDKKFEIKYEILFTANNNMKSFQYWIDDLAYNILDNSTVRLKELSLNLSSNSRFKKIIPTIKTEQIQNKNIITLNENMDKLDDFELATIGKEYQKDKILPPYELALKLELGEEFFKENQKYYNNERSDFAGNFLNNIMHAKILDEEEDNSNIKWY